MSTTTTNLGLTKPAGNERPDVDVINGNMDILDSAVGEITSLDGTDVFTVSSSFTIRDSPSAKKIGAVSYVTFSIQPKTSQSSGEITLGTLASGFRPILYTNITIMQTSPFNILIVDVTTDGTMKLNTTNMPISSGSTLWCRFMLITGI